MPETDRILGEHGARLDNLEEDRRRIDDKLDEILSTLHEAKGGWKVMLLFGSVTATLGGLVATYTKKFF